MVTSQQTICHDVYHPFAVVNQPKVIRYPGDKSAVLRRLYYAWGIKLNSTFGTHVL
jgi:hypothetical protein